MDTSRFPRPSHKDLLQSPDRPLEKSPVRSPRTGGEQVQTSQTPTGLSLLSK